jgi:hypothetical protein
MSITSRMQWNPGKSYSSKQLMVISVAQPPLLSSCYRCPQSREENHIVGVLL